MRQLGRSKTLKYILNLSVDFRSHTNWLGSMMYVKWMSRGEVVVVMASNPVVLIFPTQHTWRMASTYTTHFRERQTFSYQKYININETFLLLKTVTQRVYRSVMININGAQDLSASTCQMLLPLLPNARFEVTPCSNWYQSVYYLASELHFKCSNFSRHT